MATAAGLEVPRTSPGLLVRREAAAATPLESFSAGITSVRAAAKLSTAEVQDEIARLRSGLNLIGDELAALRKGGARREGDAADEAKHLAGERFLLVMQPFFDGCKGQVEELERSVVEMVEAQGKMKTYFSEEAKANVDELYSRWATFADTWTLPFRTSTTAGRRRDANEQAWSSLEQPQARAWTWMICHTRPCSCIALER